MTKYEYECAVDELLDKALNELIPSEFSRLLDSISMIISDYEDE